MSHNAHFIILNAEDSETAQYRAENQLLDFGNENNWYTVNNVIDLNDLTEEDKKYLEEELNFLNNELSQEKFNKVQAYIDDLHKQLADGNSSRNIYWQLSTYYKTLYELSKHKDNNLVTIETIKNMEDYFGYQFDEYGVTNICCNTDESEHTFIVEIDMHS